MKQVKIIISNYDDLKNPYYGGGGAVAIHETAKQLTSNYQVTVLTGTYQGAKNTIKDKVRYERIGIKFGGPKIGQLVYQFVLPWYVQTKRFDLWIESFTPPFSTGLLPLFTKKPVIGLVHMLSGEDMRRKYHLPFAQLEALGLKVYAHFITTSAAVQKTIRKHNSHATQVVISNGVSMPKPNHVAKKYIVFIGRIEINQKGIDLLLQAYALVYKRIPYTLVIAGNGEDNQIKKLTQLIEKHNLSQVVRYVGKVDAVQKHTLFTEAFAVVVPSRFETFSLVSLEALAYGVPLITFDIPGLTWLPETTRIMIKSFDTKALGAALVSLSGDTKRQAKLGRSAKAFAQNYSWEKTANAYDAYIQKVLSR